MEELRSEDGGVGVDETLGVPRFGVGGFDRTEMYDC